MLKLILAVALALSAVGATQLSESQGVPLDKGAPGRFKTASRSGEETAIMTGGSASPTSDTTGASELARMSDEDLVAHVAVYVKREVGNCNGAQYDFITTKEACSEAAKALGLYDTGVGSTNFKSDRPYGCLYKPSAYSVSRLWLNVQNNADQNSNDSDRLSICYDGAASEEKLAEARAKVEAWKKEAAENWAKEQERRLAIEAMYKEMHEIKTLAKLEALAKAKARELARKLAIEAREKAADLAAKAKELAAEAEEKAEKAEMLAA